MADLPLYQYTTQEDWYGELSFLDADASDVGIPLSGRAFEMPITPSLQGNRVVAPVLTLTMGVGISLKTGDPSTIVFTVPKEVAALFPRGEYTADVIEVVDGRRSVFMPVRVRYNEPSALQSFISRFIGASVTFASRLQPIISPVAITGRQGAAGNTIITGTVPPAPVNGKNGDYWIEDRTATGQGRRMYGPKAGGAWPGIPWVIQVTGISDVPGLTAALANKLDSSGTNTNAGLLGNAARLGDKTDLNTILKSGHYDVQGAVNAPDPASWFYLEVIQHSNRSGYVQQRATKLDGTAEVFIRNGNGTGNDWGSWLRVYTSSNFADIPLSTAAATAIATKANQSDLDLLRSTPVGVKFSFDAGSLKATQTVFPIPGGYTPGEGLLTVSFNGGLIEDFTATDGQNVILSSYPWGAGDVVRIRAIRAGGVVNAIGRAEFDARTTPSTADDARAGTSATRTMSPFSAAILTDWRTADITFEGACGAFGNGTQDDDAAFALAYQMMGNLAASGIYRNFRPKSGAKYSFNAPIKLMDRWGIVGDKTAIFLPRWSGFNNTKLPGMSGYDLNKAAFFLLLGHASDITQPLTGVRIKGIRIVPETLPSTTPRYCHAIRLINVVDFEVEDNDIQGLAIGDAIGGHSSRRGTINRNNIHDFYTNAAYGASLSSYYDVCAVNFDNDRIGTQYSEDIEVAFNRATNIQMGPTSRLEAGGVQGTGANAGIVIGGDQTNAYQFAGSWRINCHHNYASKLGEGIDNQARSSTFNSNIIEDASSGIKTIHGAQDNLIHDNIIRRFGLRGISLTGGGYRDSARNKIYNNKVIGCSGDPIWNGMLRQGLLLEDGSPNFAKDNQVYDNEFDVRGMDADGTYNSAKDADRVIDRHSTYFNVIKNNKIYYAGKNGGEGVDHNSDPGMYIPFPGYFDIQKIANADTVGQHWSKNVEVSVALTASRLFYLPLAARVIAGERITIRDAVGGVSATNTLIVRNSGGGNDTILNATAAQLTLAKPYDVIVLVSDGISKWTRIVSV